MEPVEHLACGLLIPKRGRLVREFDGDIPRQEGISFRHGPPSNTDETSRNVAYSSFLLFTLIIWSAPLCFTGGSLTAHAVAAVCWP